MRETFVDKSFNERAEEVIRTVDAILREYAAQGFDLTLRQTYYQCVARQPFSWEFRNEEKSYKWLGGIINDARLAGRLDWSHLVDRTRGIEQVPTWDTPGDIIESAAHSYRIDKWADQPYHVEAWVEKDALVGVLARTCKDLQIPYLSCRGYTSQSEMYVGGKRLKRHALEGKQALVLHLGDHDPSGVDMSRDIADRLHMFAGRTADLIEVRRIALTIEQVEAENPPPNPTKLSDSRARGYVDAFGMECWELDALQPTYIDRIIREHVMGVRDEPKWSRKAGRETRERAALAAVSARWDDVVPALGLSEEE